MLKPFISIFILSFFVQSHVYAQTKWSITDGYEISFSGSKAEGTFSGLEGDILFDPNNLAASKFDVSVDVSTISTGNNTKNKHARGESWFFAEKFPKIYFQSSSIVKKQSGYEVTGTLDLHGIKKTITFPFQFEGDETTGTLSGIFTLDRQDYGIEGNLFGFAVGDEFEVSLNVPVRK
ncbi:MAG: YceI family protein [Bacteroidota bacterium]